MQQANDMILPQCSAILVGVTINSQDEQKRSLRSFYQKNKVKSYDAKNNKSDGSWFEITGFKVKSGKNAKVGYVSFSLSLIYVSFVAS